ncbi:MAG: hypothetical protein IJ379_05205 [Lachnospiraceae bacterium]|nr:hypothetical protein [Lachnospiraceae bacterium]
MILTLLDVATHLAALEIVDREHIYCGKMEDKKEKCIGVYNLKRSQSKRETIGGDQNSSYRVKQVSFLVHWDKSTERTELAADSLYEAVKNIRDVTVNGKRILFTKMLTDNPVDVGTDDNGIYEMVVEAEIYYER